MALIKCSDCGREISDKAPTCPQCGAPTEAGTREKEDMRNEIKKEKRRRRGNIQGAGCLLIILAIILGLTVVGAPFAILLGLAGVVVLVVGLFS